MPSPSWKKLGRDLMRPVGDALASIGVTANFVTVLGLLFAGLCGVLLARGNWGLALLSLLLSALCDLLDGAVARARDRSGSLFGAAFDSTADRYGEALILTGILIDAIGRGVEGWFVWLWALALTGSFLTSYVRARAEGLGLRCDVGLLERPERLGLLALLCLLGPRSAWMVLAVLAVGANVTFIQRLHLIWRSGRNRGEPK